MNQRFKIGLIALFTHVTALLHAHPGHGDHTHDGFSVIHYFTEPVHLAAIAVVLLSGFLALMVRKQSQRRSAK